MKNLKQKLIIGIVWLGGLANLVNFGCATQQPVSQERTYTPEQKKAWFDYVEARDQKIREKNKAWFDYVEARDQKIRANNQIQQNNQTQQVTEQQDPLNTWIWDVYKGAFIRAGGGIIEGEYWINRQKQESK